MKKKDYQSLVDELFRVEKPTRLAVELAKKKWAKQSGQSLPKTYHLLSAYREAVRTGRLPVREELAKLLIAKPVRTLSGVAPVTVILKPGGCSGSCVYCPAQIGVPKSYLDDEPAVLRARQFDYDPSSQMKYRLGVFEQMGHSAEKIELIILGGTFSDYSRRYRQRFIQACFEAATSRQAKGLPEAQDQNEKARCRVIGVTIETRPDCVTETEIRFWRKLGVTRVEIGVQSLLPSVLKRIRRPHGLKEVVKATVRLRRAGFKICYHLMPGLPGSTPETDRQMFKKVFTDRRFRPDFLKVYPCVVIGGTVLSDWWRSGRYQPRTDDQLVRLLARVKKKVPVWVRINRLGRDIPLGDIQAGFRYSHLRQLVQKEMAVHGWKCRCIRCREVKSGRYPPGKLHIEPVRYLAQGGEEVFFQVTDRRDRLYAFLRLFLPREKSAAIFSTLKGAALIRELHTFGPSIEIGARKETASQHQGWGKQLLRRAEAEAVHSGFDRLVVIAGVGVRDYYRAQGYRLEETYMVKQLGVGYNT